MYKTLCSILLLLCSAWFLIGCNSTLGPDRGDTIYQVTEDDFDELKGVFDNRADPEHPRRGIQLISELVYNTDRIDPFLGVDRVALSPRQDGLLIRVEIDGRSEDIFLAGRYINGYLLLNTQRKLGGLPPLLNGIGKCGVQVGRLKTGELIVDREAGGCLLLVVFPIICAGGHTYSTIYPALDINETVSINSAPR